MDPSVHEWFDRLTRAHGLFSQKDNENHLLNKLKGLVVNIKWSPAEAVDLFRALMVRFESTSTNERSDFLLWMLKMLHYIEINYITPSWTSQNGKKLIELVQDKKVTDDDLKKNLDDDTEKTLDRILEEIHQQKLNQVNKKLLDNVKDIVSSVNKDLTSGKNSPQRSGLKKELLIICQAAKEVHFTPRLTQIVSLCLMALSETGQLLQVGTGEGKSCIVAMYAAFRAMRGEKVDIMSSSPVLAQRDMNEWAEFYKHLKISVDCNINKVDQEHSKKCYQSQVIYGTVEEFAGDWLRHHFQRQDIFGKRKFQCAIVDEVDSLMLDKGHHVVYLSTDMPALQHLNPLLAFIWATANQYSKIGEETVVGQKYPFHQVVLDNITEGKGINKFTILQIAEDTGILSKGSARYLRGTLNLSTEKTESITVHQLVEFFKTTESRFPTCRFSLHCKNNDGTIEELSTEQQRESEESQRIPLLLTSGGFCQYMYSDEESVLKAAEEEIKHALHFTPCQLGEDKSNIYIPGFLSHLVNSNLRVWIKNAFHAKSMKKDHEYIIETHGIVPVDYSCTGVVENFMKWSDGLQQFLEMKHGSKLSDMTLITNYMSNVGLLQKYKDQIYGISGTLGQQAETDTLQKIYEGMKTCQMPSFKRRKLFEVEGRIVDDEKKWIEKISNVVMTEANPTPYREGRAVLIICETISRAKVLHDDLADKVPNKKLYINNNMDNRVIFENELQTGDVIVATNLAGRGTDLKVSDHVNAAGGLFVVQTFLPKNARVEEQAFGRTARQGSPGSAQLIVCSSHLSGQIQLQDLVIKCLSLLVNITDVTSLFQDLFRMELRSEDWSELLLHILSKKSKSRMKPAKEIRDKLVAQQLANYLEQDIPMIKKKQELFCKYLEVLDDVYKSNNNKPADSDLSALNEFWGMWLLTNLNNKSPITDLKNRLSTDLDRARQKLKQQESPLSNLHHYTAFGNELQKAGCLAESIEMYTKAIQEDRCWAAVAFYNRAFASLTLQDRHQDPNCLDQALEDLQNALRSVELYCEQIEITHRYATQQRNSDNDSIIRFNKHTTARCKVLLFLKENINEAVKKVDRAREIGSVKVEKNLAYILIPPEHLLPLAVLLRESEAVIRSKDPLRIHQHISHPSFDIVGELRCLESLGLAHVYTLESLFSLGGYFSKIYRTIRQGFN